MTQRQAPINRGQAPMAGSAGASEAKSSYKSLDTPAQYVKGVGERFANVLTKLGIFNVRDLLFHFPRRYEDRTNFRRIARLEDGEWAAIKGKVVAVDSVPTRSRVTIIKVAIDDESGVASLVFFNQHYLKERFRKLYGKQIVAYGLAQSARWGIEISSVEWEEVREEAEPLSFGRIVPIYPLTEGVWQGTVRKIIKNALDLYASMLEDSLPERVISKHRLMGLREAVRNAHFPESEEAQKEAQRRLVFEELFTLQLALALRKQSQDLPGQGIQFAVPADYRRALHEALPFTLTPAQDRVIREIEADMAGSSCMNRLLQGDVGSGKTAVALAAILIAVKNGYQAALMAPTEILAEQHYLSLEDAAEKLGIKHDLLIGSLRAAKKREVYACAASGETQLLIGTHALIQESVEFKNLGLVVIDEQHRFGVLQRAALMQKGLNPDILVMTATPIPRTLTLTVYGDLDISVIDELPEGRKPVKTHWKHTGERQRVYESARKLIDEGRQVYVVCPLIEESEKLQARAATELAEHLQAEVFPDLRLGLLHGQVKTAEKDELMHKFRAGEIDVLVSTTVIEVGVDVPNASVMIIEDADRFGLAQLHQLRGRVGRGEHQSYCIMIGDAPTDEARKRLRTLAETNDGFIIAEEDLKLRGPGEFYGTRQSGMPALKIANIFRDIPILELARKEAFEIIEADPSLSRAENRFLQEELRRKLDGLQLATVS
ncbi:MAG: ATP-dependent DNA helicase RecG [Armatimonadota bacterium]|nr:ATP-dependent DNA helicase RecG [Armatimonadota bacterium]